MWAFLLACATPEPLDRDRDGVTADVDCDDGDGFVFPGALEVCDGRDNDCDGAIDDADSDTVALRWYLDPDGDGYADDVEPVLACVAPEGPWTRQRGDCAPDDPDVHPDQPDGCDGVDTDCDGLVDEDPDRIRFVDNDEDGYGTVEVATCDPQGTAASGGDCDDADPTVSPEGAEICNGIDDDCDGLVDDDDPDVDAPTWHPDEDADSFGVEGTVAWVGCSPPNAFWALSAGDCDDLDPDVHPGALERCDGVDSDCDGVLPSESAWADPDRPHRLELTVNAPVATDRDAVAFVDVDFRAALDAVGDSGPFAPETLTAWTQDCASGARQVEVDFTDGFARILDPADPRDPLGDGVGAVHLRFGTRLAAGEPVTVGLYFGGPAAVRTGVAVTSTSLETGHLTLRLDPDRGGLLDDLRIGGVNVLSVADAFEGNGVGVGADWVRLAEPGASARVVANAGGIGLVESQGSAAGDFAVDAWWWTYADVPVAFAKLAIRPGATLTGDLRPVQTVAPGLPGAVGVVGEGWVGLLDGLGTQWGFVTPPGGGIDLSCAGGTCWASGSEAGGDTVVAGAPWLDHRVLFVVAHDGSVPADDLRVAAFLEPPRVDVGSVASRPGR